MESLLYLILDIVYLSSADILHTLCIRAWSRYVFDHFDVNGLNVFSFISRLSTNKICVKAGYKSSSEILISKQKADNENSGDNESEDENSGNDDEDDDNDEDKMSVKTADGQTIPGSNKKDSKKGGKKTKSQTKTGKSKKGKKDNHLRFKA